MTLRHYQIFVSVCDAMNMTQAASAMYMSQSAVSQAVADMEAHYGVRLFERLPKKLSLTLAGEKLLGYARHIIRMNAEAERAMRSWNDTGVLRIGASVTIGACVLPALASSFERLSPGVSLQVTEDNTERIERLLMDDKLDLGLVEGDITLSEIVQTPFAEDELVLVCGRGHPLFLREAIAPGEMEGLRFILREVGSGTRKTFENAMAEHGLGWNAVWTCNNADTIKAAVAEGLGVSVISSRAVEREVAAGLIRIVPVEGLRFLRRFKLIHHKNKYLTQSMKAFAAFCLKTEGNARDHATGETEGGE